jgi:transketolase
VIFRKGDILPVRDGYGKALLKLGECNDQVIVFDADLATSTRSNWFSEKYPERFFDCGIAEQNMVCTASGFAMNDLIAFVTTYGVFVCGRAFDQIRNTVCYSDLNVKIVGSHGGLSVGPDGGTHQAIEDIALMSVLPNMKVFSPIDANEAYQITLAMADDNGPSFLRLAREATKVITDAEYKFQIGKVNIIEKSSSSLIISHGTIGAECLKALEILNMRGFDTGLVNCSSIKPLDEKFFLGLSEDIQLVVVEEHSQYGGLGSILAQLYAKHAPRKIDFINVGDRFGESGKPDELFSEFGLSAEKIAERVEQILK